MAPAPLHPFAKHQMCFVFGVLFFVFWTEHETQNTKHETRNTEHGMLRLFQYADLTLLEDFAGRVEIEGRCDCSVASHLSGST
jgi:hypothetical protein